MSGLMVMSLDRDAAEQLATALHWYRQSRKDLRLTEHPALAEIQAAAFEIATGSQEASGGFTALGGGDDGLRDRAFLSRRDVQRLTGASQSTVDRWLKSGELRSVRHGRLRRVARADLDVFMQSRA